MKKTQESMKRRSRRNR